MGKLTKSQISDISQALSVKDFNWLTRIAKEVGRPVADIQNGVAVQCELMNLQKKIFSEVEEPILFNDDRLKPYKVTASIILGNVVIGVQKKQKAIKASVNPEPSIYVQASTPKKKVAESIKSDFGLRKEPKKEKGCGNMFKQLFGGQDLFGKIEGVNLALMTQQLAVPVGDKFFTFDKTTQQITDVTNLSLEIGIPAYKFPTLTSQVEAGDLILFDGQFVFVTEVTQTGRIIGTNPETSKEETYSPVPVAVLGNQHFVAKVQTFDFGFGQAGDASNPMANLMPLMLLSEGGLGGNSDIDPMMIMALSGGFGGAQDGSNPMSNMLPLMLLGDKKSGSSDIDPMLLMMMMGGQNPLGNLFGGAPATVPSVDTEKEELKEEIAKLTAALDEVTK